MRPWQQTSLQRLQRVPLQGKMEDRLQLAQKAAREMRQRRWKRLRARSVEVLMSGFLRDGRG
jgi:hypothetical protein